MNFLLITKPEVRSVRLLGSWDNFSKQYVLQRDMDVGPGYWKGSHTFTDTIGHTPDNAEWRSGGLKMGSTYWYYYLLDGNVKHYSEAEPVSRECPLLLGQAVNVLNVPIILPDSRTRGCSPSRSPQASEHARTMTPEDRFMNPRRAPPQPQAQPVHLQTSGSTRRLKNPTQIPSRSPTPGIHRSASQPYSAPRKGHKKDARSMSPPRVRALMAALRNPTEVDRNLQTAQTAQATNFSNGFRNSPSQEEATQNRRNLPGITVNAGVAIPSSRFSTKKPSPATRPPTIQTRRVKNSLATDRDPRPYLTVQTKPQLRIPMPSRCPASGQTAACDDVRTIREALKDIANSSNLPTPTAAFAKERKEKRLPTLPNTPSSVMDEAVRAIDERDQAMNDEIPRSYFSAMTVSTVDSTYSRILPEHSRFSEWSTDTEMEYNPRDSMVSNSASNNPNKESTDESWNTPDLSQSSGSTIPTNPNTPHLTVNSRPSSPLNSASAELWNPLLEAPTVSPCTPYITDSELGFEEMGEVESNPKRHAALFTAIDTMQPKDLDAALLNTEPKMTEASLERIRSSSGFEGNATMQELMERLSYLQKLFDSRREEGEPF